MSVRRLRILLVTTSLLRGGAETQVFLLARAFARAGHAVRVTSLIDPEGYVAELAEEGVAVDSLGMRAGVVAPSAVIRLARIVRRFRPHVVHGHMVHANLLTRVARPLAWSPVLVSTVHSISEGARWREIAYRLTDPLCTLMTNVCTAGAKRYVRVGAVPERKVRAMPNGIEIDRYAAPLQDRAEARRRLRVDDDRFVWLSVGRLDTPKDVPNLLRAAATVNGDRPFAVRIVGEGPDRDALIAERDALGLGDRVDFLGSRADVPDLMRAADGYLMSSAWEGLPLVLIEAAAARLPIVTTDVGGNDEIVLEDRSGHLVPPHDPAALARSMERLMNEDPAGRRAMGEAGFAHVDANYRIETVADRWTELYAEVLARAER